MQKHWSPVELALLVVQSVGLAAVLVSAAHLQTHAAPAVARLFASGLFALLGFYYGGLLHLDRPVAPAGGVRRFLVPGAALLGVSMLTCALLRISFLGAASHVATAAAFAVWTRSHGMRLVRGHGFARRIAIVGGGEDARRLAGEIRRFDPRGSDVVAFVATNDAASSAPGAESPVDEDALARLVAAGDVDRVVIAESAGPLGSTTLQRCRRRGVPVETAREFRESVLGRASLDALAPIPTATPHRRYILKRAVDVAAAAAILAVGAPVCALVALAVYLEDRGPVLFRQTRVGEGERRFTLYKLRSMRPDAEASSGPVWAAARDPRSTRVGRWIRALRIDEIPQAWNILIGDMSLVGPRPERPEFEAMLREAIPGYEARHALRPGLTGWAQIHLPTVVSVEDARLKFEYDLYYVRHASWWLDAWILLRSGRVILQEWESSLTSRLDLEMEG